jgi:hypothetical protein
MARIRLRHLLLPILLAGSAYFFACGYQGPLQGAAARRQLIDDRDRIYDKFGPPDKIATYPDNIPRPPEEGEGDGFPYEDWYYHQLGGVGDNVTLEFVDDCQCGNYELNRQDSAINFALHDEKDP